MSLADAFLARLDADTPAIQDALFKMGGLARDFLDAIRVPRLQDGCRDTYCEWHAGVVAWLDRQELSEDSPFRDDPEVIAFLADCRSGSWALA
jgi:hypothetical protein